MAPDQQLVRLLLVFVASLDVERDAVVGSVALRLAVTLAAPRSWSRTPIAIRDDGRIVWCVEVARKVESVVAAKIRPPDPENLPKVGRHHCHCLHGRPL
jgi:hypothetical protein